MLLEIGVYFVCTVFTDIIYKRSIKCMLSTFTNVTSNSESNFFLTPTNIRVGWYY